MVFKQALCVSQSSLCQSRYPIIQHINVCTLVFTLKALQASCSSNACLLTRRGHNSAWCCVQNSMRMWTIIPSSYTHHLGTHRLWQNCVKSCAMKGSMFTHFIPGCAALVRVSKPVGNMDMLCMHSWCLCYIRFLWKFDVSQTPSFWSGEGVKPAMHACLLWHE